MLLVGGLVCVFVQEGLAKRTKEGAIAALLEDRISSSMVCPIPIEKANSIRTIWHSFASMQCFLFFIFSLLVVFSLSELSRKLKVYILRTTVGLYNLMAVQSFLWFIVQTFLIFKDKNSIKFVLIQEHH